MMTRTRIVAVSYLNTIPFIYGIEHAGFGLHDGLLLSPPSGCAAALAEGRAEIGLIPVAAIPSLSHFDIITPFCIGASGPVRTVVLFAQQPLEQLKRIYLDPHSLTSVRLARILASEKWGIEPEWLPLTDYGGLADRDPEAGYVLIGDKVFEYEECFAIRYDLAREWQTLTGLPFVFAAWVAKKGVDPAVIASLESALRYGTEHIPQAIGASCYAQTPYALDYLTHNIDYRFDLQKRRALQLYWEKGMKIDPRVNPG